VKFSTTFIDPQHWSLLVGMYRYESEVVLWFVLFSVAITWDA
jgi:hypothetical protein